MFRERLSDKHTSEVGVLVKVVKTGSAYDLGRRFLTDYLNHEWIYVFNDAIGGA